MGGFLLSAYNCALFPTLGIIPQITLDKKRANVIRLKYKVDYFFAQRVTVTEKNSTDRNYFPPTNIPSNIPNAERILSARYHAPVTIDPISYPYESLSLCATLHLPIPESAWEE